MKKGVIDEMLYCYALNRLSIVNSKEEFGQLLDVFLKNKLFDKVN